MAKILHDKRFIWILFILIALLIFFSYLLNSIQAGHGNLLMPLDDVYIHFQYARQMATGHPYQYNNIDPPTSGATSFIYPYILAFGYLIGFHQLWLGLWAMLIGVITMIASMWAVYRLCKAFDVPQYLSLLTVLSFALTGSIAWHFMSGMETGLMIMFTLWTALLVLEKRLYSFLLVASLLSITRPEGAILAFFATGTMFLRLWPEYGAQEKRSGQRVQLFLLIIPILAIGIQPLVNLLITGSTVATGNQAKSILATVPHDWGIIISRIVDNFIRMWTEFVTGYDGLEGRGWYLPLFTGLLGLLAMPMLLFKKNYRLMGLMFLAYFLTMTAAISTLDTAFWHFKRYQMPMLALFFPMAAWVVSMLISYVEKRASPLRYTKYLIFAYQFAIVPIFVAALFFQFLHYYAVNVGYVYQQPYQMALWLRDNTPEDALIAVHDVGVMRYIGQRNTLDIVGLTTPGAAAYWRNGPGSVAEFLIDHQPDYIASYGRGHGYGLAYLADTSLYANELAAFPINDWQPYLNVALAANFQGIYKPDWVNILYRDPHIEIPSRECYSTPYSNSQDGWLLYLQVADVNSESLYDYEWSSHIVSGFATEVRQFAFVLEGYRLINQFEQFTFRPPTDELPSLVLISAVHATAAGTIDIYIDDKLIDTQWIPENPGHLFYITTLLEKKYLHDNMQIRIVPHIPDGYYMPACHLIRPFADNVTGATYPFPANSQVPEALVTYQNKSFFLTKVNWEITKWTDPHVEMNLRWYSDGKAQGDYRFFAHLYDDINQPPIAQWDGYFADMPIGNWLPGYLQDTIDVNIKAVPPGTYELAIGFYNAQNPQDRLIPESDVYEVSPDGRLWLGEITINDH